MKSPLRLSLARTEAAAAGSLNENESVRPVLPCRDREVSNISGGVMFDWGLLAPPALFLFVNRLPGNVVIIVVEASICSFGGGGWGAALVSNPFSQVLMGGRGVEAVDVGRRGGSSVEHRFIHPGVSTHSATRLSLLVPANGSDPAGFNWERGS